MSMPLATRTPAYPQQHYPPRLRLASSSQPRSALSEQQAPGQRHEVLFQLPRWSMLSDSLLPDSAQQVSAVGSALIFVPLGLPGPLCQKTERTIVSGGGPYIGRQMKPQQPRSWILSGGRQPGQRLQQTSVDSARRGEIVKARRMLCLESTSVVQVAEDLSSCRHGSKWKVC